MKVSIIVPVYNVEKYLEQCLDSLVSQTLKDIEIICINDGSTDNSLELLNKYAQKDTRIKVLSQENKGAGAARNKGIELAQGEYLGFVDPDDWVEPDMYEEMYISAQTNNIDMLQTNYEWVVEETGKRTPVNKFNDYKITIPPYTVFDKNDIRAHVLKNIPHGACFAVFKKSFVLDNNIKFGEQFWGEDKIFTIKSRLCAQRMMYIDKNLYHYRIRQSSATYNSPIDYNGLREAVLNLLKELKLDVEFSNQYDSFSSSLYTYNFDKLSKKQKKQRLQHAKNNLTKKQYEILRKSLYQNNIFEQFFSIRNRISKGVKRKIITILGIKIKIKVKS